MLIYLLLILITIFGSQLFSNKNRDNGIDKSLIVTVIGMFLVFALRNSSVGRDVLGYKQMYLSFSNTSFRDYNIYWTEAGFNILELICCHYLKISWQAFLALVYGFICISYYRFLKNESMDANYSIFIYIMMGYFIFDLSAIRTSLALSICLFGVPYMREKNAKSVIKFIIITLIAAQIHTSAYIFAFYYIIFLFNYTRFKELIYIILPIIAVLVRSVIMRFATFEYKGEFQDASVNIGGNTILYFAILLLSFFIIYSNKSGYDLCYSDVDKVNADYNAKLVLPFNMVYIGVLLSVALGDSIFSRMAHYGLFYTSVLVPNVLFLMNRKDQLICRVFFSLFLFVYYFYFKIKVNELDFLPYRFFWN